MKITLGLLLGFLIVGLVPDRTSEQRNSTSAGHVLDLGVTQPNEPTLPLGAGPDHVLLWAGPPVIGTGQPAPRFPFEATIAYSDRTAYQVGDSLIYALRLKNVSGQATTFPWSGRPDDFNTRMTGLRAFALNLMFSDPELGDQAFGSRKVFGAIDVPGSLRSIAPNEELEIRSAVQINLHRTFTSSMPPRWTKALKIKAFMVLITSDEVIQPGTSTNELVIHLEQRH